MIEVEPILQPVKAWRVFRSGADRVMATALPDRLVVFELSDQKLVRTDTTEKGDRQATVYEAPFLENLDEVWLEIKPLPNNGACMLAGDTVWIFAHGSFRKLDLGAWQPDSLVGKADSTVILNAWRSEMPWWHLYELNGNGTASLHSRVRAPLIAAFDFPEAAVHVFEDGEWDHEWWRATVRPRNGMSFSRIGPFESRGMLWYDGALIVQNGSLTTEGVHYWVHEVPILEATVWERLSYRAFPFFLPSRRLRRMREHVHATFGNDLIGWHPVPFSRYSVCDIDENPHAVRWSSLDTDETGIWDFGFPLRGDHHFLIHPVVRSAASQDL